MGLFNGIVNTISKLASPITSVINGVSSLGSTLINRHSQKETNKSNQYLNDTNLAFNKEQNEQTRQFNAEEAEKARQFNAAQSQLQFDRSADFEREMWNLQNEYNTPAAQIQRLKDAGINPNMFSSDGNTAGSVGSATSSAASSPAASASALGAPNAIPKQPLSFQNPLFEAAQIRLANAQADKAEADSNLSNTQSKRLDALLDGELKLQNSTYNVQMSESMRNEADAKKSLAEIEHLNADKDRIFAQVDEIRANIHNLRLQGQLTDKELDSYETRLAYELKERLSRVNLNNKSALACLASAEESESKARLNDKEAELVCKQIVHQAISNDIIKIDYRIKDKTEVSTVKLINDKNQLGINDIKVQDMDDWRYPRLFLGTIGEVFGANMSLDFKNINKQ